MITDENFMQIILQKVPQFTEHWEKHLAYWEGDERGPCIDISSFSDYVISLIIDEDLSQLPRIFDLMERFIVEGEETVGNVVTTCFLENIINRTGATIDPKSFVHLLGPQSRIYCQAWDEFTGMKTEGLWRHQDVLGGSPMPQKDELFTLETYKELLIKYRKIHKRAEYLPYQHPLQDQLSSLRREYRSRLPIYLLARCPICGGRVSEPIDTFSLNGIGWARPQKRGYGWYGVVQATSSSRRTTLMGSSPSYKAECDHVRLLAAGVNLNCLQPDDVDETIEFLSERPYVMAPLLELDNSYAVLHTLPVGRLDDLKLQPHYTAYFVTYFTADEAAYENILRDSHGNFIIPGFADYDLLKWIEAGKLFWLDPNQEASTLMDRSSSADFPYNNMKGFEGPCTIEEGQIKQSYKNQHQKAHLCDGVNLNEGFFKNLWNSIFG
ncbi:MAG: hypothetical protein IPJ90_15935 [Anaerolineaceae bacterium]|nr:hypothetical protein [Anaerolineaceae bacterium]